MAKTILQQPDGLWCVWSSIIDDFVATDATLEEVEEWLVNEKMDYFRKAIKANIEDAVAGNQRGFGPKTYDEAMKARALMQEWRGIDW